MTSRLLCLAAVLGSLVLSSCSISFDQDWRKATKAGPTKSVEGAWAGTWHSDATGHHGDLRCIVGPAQANHEHDFFYHAIWKHILSGSYHASHKVAQTPTGYSFEGQHKMPDWAGGLYTYHGAIRGDDFRAHYQCASDHGTYVLKRVR